MQTVIKKNFHVLLKPDTLQQTYLDMTSELLTVEALTFNDGSIRVTLPEMNIDLEHRYCEITAFIENLDDLSIIAQIKDIITRLSKAPRIFSLTITSTSYTRYDRVMLNNQTDAFGAKVFADLVNGLGFNFVNLFDCHSKVMLDLLNNSVNIGQDDLVQDTLYSYSDFIGDYNIIAPDKGAAVKLNNPAMIFDKVRNLATGEITGMQIIHDDSDVSKEYLVIDDICEGGRTFIEVAKLFKEKKDASINLYVTHGIFSNGAIEKLLQYYSKIYVQFMKESDFNALPEEQSKYVFVNKLITV